MSQQKQGYPFWNTDFTLTKAMRLLMKYQYQSNPLILLGGTGTWLTYQWTIRHFLRSTLSFNTDSSLQKILSVTNLSSSSNFSIIIWFDKRPFILDLESTNGTFVNGIKVPTKRYVELISGDKITFGESSRDYVFLCESEVE